jgi:hypothetical protein
MAAQARFVVVKLRLLLGTTTRTGDLRFELTARSKNGMMSLLQAELMPKRCPSKSLSKFHRIEKPSKQL